MMPQAAPESYPGGSHPHLLQALPRTARRILDVGCADGRFGAALKALDATREVYGIECDPAAAGRAAACIDRVFTLDVQADDPPIEPGGIDCIIYADVLEHLARPEGVLRRQRRFLAPGGIVLCSIPNVQHWSVVVGLLKGDFQYTASGLLGVAHLRLFTCSTFMKLLLDSGYSPALMECVTVPCPADVAAALQPVLAPLGLDARRTRRYLDAYQYIFRAEPTYPAASDPCASGTAVEEVPLSFVVCVSNELTLQANLLSSPCLAAGSPHEVIPVRGAASAAHGLHQGIARARHALVVCLHQDVYLPAGWPGHFLAQYHRAAAEFGAVGVAGVYGVALDGERVRRMGHVLDRERVLKEGPHLPARVDTLDEVVLALPKDSPLRFDPALGFHFYGADVCLAARRRGLAVVALDALCFHNSAGVGLPPAFFESGRTFTAKWADALPVATSCVVIDRNGTMRVS